MEDTRRGEVRIARFLAAIAATWAGVALAQSADDLRALLEKGRPTDAYAMGRATPQRLGEPAFDLYFGIAAVNAGHAAEGVLALERFVLAEPGHLLARVELARGYFLVGEDRRAREEFEAALGSNPDAAIARVIGDYLEALRARESRYRPTLALHAEAGAGYDSNPRAGVASPLLTLPVVGEVTIAEAGVQRPDHSAQLAAGFRATAPVSARSAAFISGQAETVRYRHLDEFEQDIYAGSAGFLGRWREHSWRAGVVEGYQTLGHVPYRRTHGGFGDWALSMSERSVISGGVQAGRFEYLGTNTVRDSDFATVGLSARRALALALDPQLELTINGGYERNIHAERQDLSRRMYGARAGIAIAPLGAWTIGGAVLYQRSRYGEPDALLLTRRDDRYMSGEASIACRPWRQLSLRLEYTEAKNDSNIALFEYRRRTAMIRGRYEFR